MRKTQPVAEQVTNPMIQSNAFLKKRLVDFDTGKADLELQHKTWLAAAINQAKTNTSLEMPDGAYRVRLFAFASRRGDANANLKLSRARLQEVYGFLKSFDGNLINKIEMFDAFGESESTGAANDDHPVWRAVEVHIFIGDIPPDNPPPQAKRYVPPPPPPLPGGPRYKNWEVAMPGGLTVSVGAIVSAVIGVNFIAVRNAETKEIHYYLAPTLGVGVGISLPGGGSATGMAKVLQDLAKSAATGTNFSNLDFTAVSAPVPVTFDEVDKALVVVTGANAALFGPVGASAAHVRFYSAGVYQYGPSGTPLKLEQDLWRFNSVGTNYQIGAGAGSSGQPLMRINK